VVNPSKTRKNIAQLNDLRRQAVQLRRAGNTLRETQAHVGLTAPTIIAACKAYEQGGWEAVDVGARGRPRSNQVDNTDDILGALVSQSALSPDSEVLHTTAPAWSIETLNAWGQERGHSLSHSGWIKLLKKFSLYPQSRYRQLKREASSTEDGQFQPANWQHEHDRFVRKARREKRQVLWLSSHKHPSSRYQELTQLCAHDLRGQLHWCLVNGRPTSHHHQQFLMQLSQTFDNRLALVLTNPQLMRVPQLASWATNNQCRLLHINEDQQTATPYSVFASTPMATASHTNHPTPSHPTMSDSNNSLPSSSALPQAQPDQKTLSSSSLTHLQRLEAESLHIMREVVAEAENPVMLYSIGKDSAVMLHLARKAFFPSVPPFPLLHVDTTWKFKAMYEFRDTITERYNLELMVHVNEEGVRQQVNPFTHGSALHTDIMKTQGLKQALDKHRFDFAFGGARRDEEKSRAKERVFSFRNAQHRWDAKNQRPELWQLYNTRKQKDESIRVFPLSNWTELDIWQYIHKEDIPIVPLYLAAKRPVVERDGSLIMVDDERMPLKPNEVPELRSVRFRTLGCYPLTGAVESTANTLEEIIQEMLLTRTSERQGRMIDHDSAASMEKKKQEGYF